MPGGGVFVKRSAASMHRGKAPATLMGNMDESVQIMEDRGCRYDIRKGDEKSTTGKRESLGKKRGTTGASK